MNDTATKHCRGCQRDLPLDAFGRHARHADGRQSRCKECKRAADHARWFGDLSTSRASHREVARRYSENNPEAVRESKARYREANRKVLRAKNRDMARQKYQQNPGEGRRRVREQGYALRATVFDHYGITCSCCGTTERLTIDHVNGDGAVHRKELFGRQQAGIPFYRWLINQGFPDGFKVLCQPCNKSKDKGKACRLRH